MKNKKLLIPLLSLIFTIGLIGCASKTTSISAETKDAIDNLNSIQANYASGVAPLIEIPPVWAEEIYNNADTIVGSDIEGAPIQLREYAVTNTVYFDYSDDFSVVWDKNTNSVSVEPTDTAEREAFKEKMHK